MHFVSSKNRSSLKRLDIRPRFPHIGRTSSSLQIPKYHQPGAFSIIELHTPFIRGSLYFCSFCADVSLCSSLNSIDAGTGEGGGGGYFLSVAAPLSCNKDIEIVVDKDVRRNKSRLRFCLQSVCPPMSNAGPACAD